MNKLLYILYIFLLIACKQNKNTSKEDSLVKIDTTEVQLEELPIHVRLTPKKLVKDYPKLTDTHEGRGILHAEKVKTSFDNRSMFSTTQAQKKVSNNQSIQEFESSTQILLPTIYRLNLEEKTLADNLNSNWFDFTKQGEECYLNKPNYTIKKGEDECSGALTKTIISNNKTLLFIDNKQLKLGKINTINLKKNKIWPNEKVTFKYNNTTYTIRAEGTIISSENEQTDIEEERFYEVENYKLYISTNNTNEMLFLEEKSFNDTFVKLLFVGDIDADGKLDLLFEANRYYEEKRVILYLSSEAKNKEIIKKAAEIAVSFGC